jgi:hypothetical protein
MKLAEALSKRSQLMEKVSQLKVRLNDCIKVQEGDVPAESPDSVIKELDRTLEELGSLIYHINLTNTLTEVDGQTITSLLALRDVRSMKVKTLGEALKVLTEREDRYNRNEIRFVRTVDVKDFRHIYDRSAAELRELDLRIQALGWTTELIEK